MSRPFVLAAMALCGFAANSLLCRLALRPGRIDAASFTGLRVASGAIMLLAVLAVRERRVARPAGDWRGGLLLFAYAAPFSFAYLELSAGTGALLLFGSVQATMLGVGIARGERPRAAEWIGLALALGGLVLLAAPGASAPEPLAAVLMVAAGAAWGFYSLHGRRSARPLVATAGNFARALPMAALMLAAVPAAGGALHADAGGVAFALASGALASGLGYALWYAALPSLTATRAAIVQLLVPVLTAAAAVVVLDERPSLRLVIAGTAILGGVLVAVLRR